jgi:hypothetical protein
MRRPIQLGLAAAIARTLGDVGDGKNAFAFSFAAFFFCALRFQYEQAII